MAASDSISICEVGPRDGLQNEPVKLSIDHRLALIAALARSGLSRIEVGSFVRPEWIPQLADTDALVQRLPELHLGPKVRLSALVPNRAGLRRAAQSGLRDVAVFMSVTETHNQRNTNKSITASLLEFEQLIPEARALGLTVRGYLSCVWGCPYEGRVHPLRALELAARLRDFGVTELSLGDTIGIGNPRQTRAICELFFGGSGSIGGFSRSELAVHLHDTHGTALVNSLMAYEAGIRTFDTSVGGTGGCPYAPGAAGNLATEDLVSMFLDMGVPSGVELESLFDAGALAQDLLGKKLPGRRLQAALGRRAKAQAGARGETALPLAQS